MKERVEKSQPSRGQRPAGERRLVWPPENIKANGPVCIFIYHTLKTLFHVHAFITSCDCLQPRPQCGRQRSAATLCRGIRTKVTASFIGQRWRGRQCGESPPAARGKEPNIHHTPTGAAGVIRHTRWAAPHCRPRHTGRRAGVFKTKSHKTRGW